MKHVVITTNTPENITTMSNYSNTELVHSDNDFAWWECTDLSPVDEDAINGYGVPQTVKCVVCVVMNKPPEE